MLLSHLVFSFTLAFAAAIVGYIGGISYQKSRSRRMYASIRVSALEAAKHVLNDLETRELTWEDYMEVRDLWLHNRVISAYPFPIINFSENEVEWGIGWKDRPLLGLLLWGELKLVMPKDTDIEEDVLMALNGTCTSKQRM